MHDDFIQGIIFSRSTMVDLRRMSRSERMMYKMLATKRMLRTWSVKPAHRPANQREFVAVRDGAHRQADLQALSSRFKVTR
ncbi:MAG TPA: hypothetical protein VGE30_00630 [Candidatus Saccharimonadales bacterium]